MKKGFFLILALCYCLGTNAQKADSLGIIVPDSILYLTYHKGDSLSKQSIIDNMGKDIPQDSVFAWMYKYLSKEKESPELDSVQDHLAIREDTLDLKPKIAQIEWDTIYHDFGEIKTDTIVSHAFVFKNTGTGPLLIHKVKTSCGCTVSDYPKEAILPDEKRDFIVHFESKNRLGVVEQAVIAYDNTKGRRTILKIKAKIQSPK